MQLHKTLKCKTGKKLNIKGKHLWFAFLFTSLLQVAVQQAQGQEPAKLWHDKPRELRYHPDGQDFVINNGKRRFNRALYGTNTAFRLEAGDLPEFALYLPGMGGNLKFGLVRGDQSKWLIDAKSVEARYRPGSMIYTIKDELLGSGVLTIKVLAGSTDENIIVKVNFSNTDKPVKLLWAFGGATGKKFSRDGDIGADPESSFYLKPEYCNGNVYTIGQQQFSLNFSGKAVTETARYEANQPGVDANKAEAVIKNVLYGSYPASQQVHIADANQLASPLGLLQSKGDTQPVITGLADVVADKDLFWVVQNAKNLQNTTALQLFSSAESARKKVADRVVLKTPDPYLNTFGGALSVAADGIWESPSYMHGAVAWRMRLNAWRGPYVADPLGWHDRAWSHFSSYALSQLTEPETGPVVADTALHLARQQEKIGNSMFSSGYIMRNPGGGKLVAHHYDMNLVYIDELLNHFKWTGDLAQVKEMWPVITRHLAWEKRNYDADGDGLYDAYCAIWASDALQYSGGGVTHSSAYNYRANKTAAYLAKLIGKDPKPYEQEATHILNAINKQLWLPNLGQYAEYKDLLGLQLVHPSAGLWTVYHAIDSEVPDNFQTYQALRYVDTQIPHIPLIAKGLTGKDYLLSTTNWEPYDWSLNNVVMAENLHTALAYWQGNRQEDAYKLWKSAILESMYLGASPGNFQQISFYDAQRGELYRDFADPIGMAARSLVEGLFGIRPDLLKDELTIKPGLPAEWNYASLSVPDVKFDFKRTGNTDIYIIAPSFQKLANLKFEVAARAVSVASVTVNGQPVKWSSVNDAVGQPVLRVIAGKKKRYQIKIVWKGEKPGAIKPQENYINLETIKVSESKLMDPQHIIGTNAGHQTEISALGSPGPHTYFVEQKQGAFTWWQPVNINVIKPFDLIADKQQNENTLNFKIKSAKIGEIKIVVNPELAKPYQQQYKIDPSLTSKNINVPVDYLLKGSNHIRVVSDDGLTVLDTNLINWHITPTKNINIETINLRSYFNDKLTNIFKNQYLSPRPKSVTLQLPTQGIGNWAYPLITANIDDSGLKKVAVNGMFTIPQGISFATPTGDDKNILFTSQWDNYLQEASVPLSGNASHAYFLMAGSTNPMQSRMVNGTVTVTYTDGTKSVLQLKNPENWWPIEQDDDNDGFAFNTGAPKPLRVYLKTGEVTDNNKKFIGIKGFAAKGIDGGAATVLDLPLNKGKTLKSLQLSTLTNDVVIGLMAVTLIRE